MYLTCEKELNKL